MPSKTDSSWQDEVRDRIATPDKAVALIRPGQRVFVGTGCAQPQELVRALAARSGELVDTQIVHLLTMGDAPYAHRELAQHFSVNSFFISENVRDVIQEGLGNYTPIFLSDIPRLFTSGQLPLDVGIAGFTAEVLRQNRAMQAVIAKSGFEAQSHLEDDVYVIKIVF